jgi:hypothetical protein
VGQRPGVSACPRLTRPCVLMPYDPGMPDATRYELRITATGEVRDADGNLLSSEPVEAVAVLAEDEARALLERQNQE